MFQAVARNNYSESCQCESVTICPEVMMEAKPDLQDTIRNSLVYTIGSRQIMARNRNVWREKEQLIQGNETADDADVERVGLQK